eukprot:scaffold576_cov336-Pavlova_lutheri.AAC.22
MLRWSVLTLDTFRSAKVSIEAKKRVCRFDSDVEVNFWRVPVRTARCGSESSARHVSCRPKGRGSVREKGG